MNLNNNPNLFLLVYPENSSTALKSLVVTFIGLSCLVNQDASLTLLDQRGHLRVIVSATWATFLFHRSTRVSPTITKR